MDTNDLELLKDYIIGAKKVARIIDEDNFIFSYENSPLIFDWKTEGFRIEYLLIDDIFNWLYYLGLGDGFIADEEVEFINFCLDRNYTKDQIRKVAISKLNKDFKSNIPLSFILFCEAEFIDKDLILSHSVPTYSDNLFRLFGRLGESFISCDCEISSDEKTVYNEYLILLWQNLTDFKARRGIDDTYENIIGDDVSIEDITIKNNNLNKKIKDKLNLVLKLLSQGYSLQDLNNIAYLSADVIAKWFYLGRLGDKNFEKFYFKCIELDSKFENDIDNVIVHIDVVNVDDSIYDKDNQIPKSNNKIEGQKSNKIQINHIYELQIAN